MNLDSIIIRPLTPIDFDEVITLGNKVHGAGYLDNKSMEKILERSLCNDNNCSFVIYDNASDDQKLIGFRLTYAPQSWPIDKWCSPETWPIDQNQVAYFKCNTIHPDYQGQGLGGLLLQASIKALKEMGAKAGLSHIWMQSPGNASYKYFTKAGGKLIKTHARRWYKDETIPDYVCIICGVECYCDASEMLLEF